VCFVGFNKYTGYIGVVTTLQVAIHKFELGTQEMNIVLTT